jgi:hypothetical protein
MKFSICVPYAKEGFETARQLSVCILNEPSAIRKLPVHHLDLCKIANALMTRGGLLHFGSIVKVNRHYQPITAILYTSRMITVASAVQEVSV